MGNDVVLPDDRQSLPEPFGPVRGHGLHLEDRDAAGGGLDLQSLLRILNEHRKLILAAMVVGLIGGADHDADDSENVSRRRDA